MRIIGGRFKGHDLGPVPAGVRPTTDRVRESLFSILGPLDGLRVLDLFAGTGALGLEALSRGADCVHFIEVSKPVQRALRQRLSRLPPGATDQTKVWAGSAEKILARIERDKEPPFDLVFMDPPYADLEKTSVLVTLTASPLLSENAMVVVEGPKRHALAPPSGLRVVDERRYGETKLIWLRRTSAEPHEPGDRGRHLG